MLNFVSSRLLSVNEDRILKRVRFILNPYNKTAYYCPLTSSEEPLDDVIIEDIKRHTLAFEDINEYSFTRIKKLAHLDRIEQLLSLEVEPTSLLQYTPSYHVRDVAQLLHKKRFCKK